MTAQPRDEQQEHFRRKTEDEAMQTPLDAADDDLGDQADTRPGRAAVTDQPGEPTPSGLVGQRDFPNDEATSSN